MKFLLLLIFLFSLTSSYAQRTTNQNQHENNSAIWQMSNRYDQLLEDDLLSHVSKTLSIENALVLIKNDTDEMGFQHKTYLQYYNGVRIENATLIIHLRDNNVTSSSSNLVKDIKINTVPYIDNNHLMQYLPDSSNVYGFELLLTKKKDYLPLADTNIVLSYCCNLGENGFVYIDANNGETIKKHPTTICSGDDVLSRIITLYNGYKFIYNHRDNGYYYLQDLTRGSGITAKEFIPLLNIPRTIRKTSNSWSSDKYRKPASALWAMSRAYDYYYDNFNLRSFDGNDAEIIIQETWNNYKDNACWIGNDCVFRFGNAGSLSSGPWVSLDIVGHEYTHAVIQFSTGMNNQYETGALVESFADIFGTMLEYFEKGDNANYTIGEDFYIENGKLRDLKDPKSKMHPDTYHGEYWASDTITNSKFIHINNGVQNRWFYLLSEGGCGINDNNEDYSVTGIGREKASKIAYRNMTRYLPPTANYSDAKNGSILSAIDLFGLHSEEVLQTILAWDAVGVSSLQGIFYNLNTNAICDSLTANHHNNVPINIYCTGSIISACNYEFNGVPVVYAAGNEVVLEDGFCSGNNFLATTISSITPKTSDIIDNNENTFYSNLFTKEDTIIPVLPDDVKLYPNPTNNHAYLTSSEEISDLVVYNMYGETILRKNLHDGSKQISLDLRFLNRGSYIIKIIKKSGKTTSLKFEKQ